MKSFDLRYILGIISFLLGVSIYLLWRDIHHLVFYLFDSIGLSSPILFLRNLFSFVNPPEWVLYSLPDGLWSLAYILIIDAAVGKYSELKIRLFWISIIPIIGILSEIMQLSGWLIGTFDPIDLISYTLPLIIYTIYIIIYRHYYGL